MRGRRRPLCYCCVACLVLCSFIPEIPARESIELWYGEEQQFGVSGLAQPYLNIPGNVSSPDLLTSLSFRINDGPGHALNIGPDDRRLSAPGDFNIEIDAEALHPGKNTIHISRTNKNTSRAVQDVTVEHTSKSWPLPYGVKWAEVENIQDAVQVLDGMWEITKFGIRTAPGFIGYDRALAIGDKTWSSYEISLSFRLNSVDVSAYDSPESVSPGLGLILHWNGHSDSPIDCVQPHCGWFPFGAIHWYTIPKKGQSGFSIKTKPINDLSVSLPFILEPGRNYQLRSQVKRFPLTTLYSLKVWAQGKKEPLEWSLQQTADLRNPDHGGFLMVAHHVDLTIGNIEVRPINASEGREFREYLHILPQILTITAAFLFLCCAGVNKKFRQGSRLFGLSFLLTALLLLICLKPLLPIVLRQFPINAAMSAALYLAYDFSSIFLQMMIWGLIILSLFCKKYPEDGA